MGARRDSEMPIAELPADLECDLHFSKLLALVSIYWRKTLMARTARRVPSPPVRERATVLEVLLILIGSPLKIGKCRRYLWALFWHKVRQKDAVGYFKKNCVPNKVPLALLRAPIPRRLWIGIKDCSHKTDSRAARPGGQR